MSIKSTNLFFSYNPKEKNIFYALNDVNVEIVKGSFTAIVGYTGSGKSTLIQHFNALLLPTKGTLEVDGFNLQSKHNKDIKKLRKHVGVVFQFPEYQLFEETVEKDVAYGPKNFGLNEEEALSKAHEALKSVGIGEEYFKKSPFELSGGEKRRIAIAGILALEPEILILDEPTAGLDPYGTDAVMKLLTKMNKDEKTIIMVSHNMDLVSDYCDHVIVMKDGNVKYQGLTNQLFSTLKDSHATEMPLFQELIFKLNSKGYRIDQSKIKTINELVDYLKENKHE